MVLASTSSDPGLRCSVAAYRGAVRAALGYGELVRAAFDVHRRDLLKEMGLILPESLDAERALWAALAQQLYRGLTGRPRLPAHAAHGL
ncbi:hypothetical protein ACWGK1_01090 [Streptomyces wedmorensis]